MQAVPTSSPLVETLETQKLTDVGDIAPACVEETAGRAVEYHSKEEVGHSKLESGSSTAASKGSDPGSVEKTGKKKSIGNARWVAPADEEERLKSEKLKAEVRERAEKAVKDARTESEKEERERDERQPRVGSGHEKDVSVRQTAHSEQTHSEGVSSSLTTDGAEQTHGACKYSYTPTC